MSFWGKTIITGKETGENVKKGRKRKDKWKYLN
jgi:hypothetical protein